MASTLHFPSAEVMKSYLSKHELLNTDYNQEKGITEAVANLAAERFANSDKVEMGIKMRTMLMVNDLKCGKDGLSGKALPNLGNLGLSQVFWMTFSMSIEQALIDCAKNAEKEAAL